MRPVVPQTLHVYICSTVYEKIILINSSWCLLMLNNSYTSHHGGGILNATHDNINVNRRYGLETDCEIT